MGKTNITYRDRVNQWEEDLQTFRKWLRQPRRAVFDQMLDNAAEMSAAAGEQNTVDIETPLLVSICLSQQEELNELNERVDQVEETIDA